MLAPFREDFRAVERNDPSARSVLETVLFRPSLHAIWLHRIAHALVGRASLLSAALAAIARAWSGVEIHPGARIGPGLFIDHGTGIVIGETAEVGRDCVLFHNVTLGGTGRHRGKRHPTLGDEVFVGTGATLLGPIRVGDRARIGAGAFIIMHDVPADTTVVGTPARVVKRAGQRASEPLAPTELPTEAIPIALRQGGQGTGGES